MTIPPRARSAGVVVAYDDHAGFGEIEADAEPPAPGGPAPRYWFHCTQIADGSRHVEPGQQVTFRLVPGHRGRWEAAEVTKTT